MNKPFLIASLSGCLSLTGCTGSTYSSHFDCPYGAGVGCASLSKVNRMIDRQEINLEEDDHDAPGTYPPAGKQVYVYYGPNHSGRLVSLPAFPGE